MSQKAPETPAVFVWMGMLGLALWLLVAVGLILLFVAHLADAFGVWPAPLPDCYGVVGGGVLLLVLGAAMWLPWLSAHSE